MRQWVVVTFPPSALKEIKRRTRDIKVTIYCPMVTKRWAVKGVVKEKRTPLLFNYMFLHFDPAKVKLSSIMEVAAVYPVKYGGKVAIVKRNQIVTMKEREKEINTHIIRVRSDADYIRDLVGCDVVIRDGVFDGLDGVVVSVSGPGVVNVEIVIFNRELIYEVSVDRVEFPGR